MARIGACAFFFAVVGMLIVTTNAAYSCADVQQRMKLPAKLKAGASCNRTGDDAGPCDKGDSECCELDTTRCGGALAGVTCTAPATEYVDWTVTGSTAAVCCKNRALCSTFTCPAGKKQKTGTNYCMASACDGSDKYTCCEDDTTKCKAHNCLTKPHLAGSDGTTGATAALCCGDAPTCGTYVYVAEQSDGSTVTVSLDLLCSKYYEGRVYDSTKAATELSFKHGQDIAENWAGCCKAAAVPTCATWAATNVCDDGTYMAGYTVAGATKAICCLDQPTCAAFAAAGALVSGAHGVAHAAWASVLLLSMLTNFVLQM